MDILWVHAKNLNIRHSVKPFYNFEVTTNMRRLYCPLWIWVGTASYGMKILWDVHGAPGIKYIGNKQGRHSMLLLS